MSDSIDRKAAIANAISGLVRIEDGEKWIRVSEVRESLLNMPSVEPERKKGRWLNHLGLPLNDFCSVCAKDSPYNKHWDFCPNCGADMRGEQDV